MHMSHDTLFDLICRIYKHSFCAWDFSLYVGLTDTNVLVHRYPTFNCNKMSDTLLWNISKMFVFYNSFFYRIAFIGLCNMITRVFNVTVCLAVYENHQIVNRPRSLIFRGLLMYFLIYFNRFLDLKAYSNKMQLMSRAGRVWVWKGRGVGIYLLFYNSLL